MILESDLQNRLKYLNLAATGCGAGSNPGGGGFIRPVYGTVVNRVL